MPDSLTVPESAHEHARLTPRVQPRLRPRHRSARRATRAAPGVGATRVLGNRADRCGLVSSLLVLGDPADGPHPVAPGVEPRPRSAGGRQIIVATPGEPVDYKKR